MSVWSLGWRSLWRDLRAGELRLLLVSVTLAVAALSAVGFLSDRLQGGLERDARQLLGGDAVVASDQPLPPDWSAQVRRLGLQQATSISFPTMARAPDAQGGAAKLVALKAVQPGYPLRGSLRTASSVEGADSATRELPASGEAWVDAAVLDALNLRVGDTLLLGESRLRIGRVIVVEPDRGAGFLNFAPRVLLNAADLAATQLVQPASRLSYRLAVAGGDAVVQRFVSWAQAQLAAAGLRNVRLESLQSGRPEMQQTLARAQQFLNLVALLAALLSAVAVALAARAFAASHLDDCALLRVLGLPQRRILGSYCVEFLLLGLAASAFGLVLGYGVHLGFVALLAGLVEVSLPAPSLRPVALGLGMGLTLLLAFGLPPVLQLAQVPALRVLRRDLGSLRAASVGALGLGVAGFAALLLVLASDRTLGLIAVGGFALAVLLFALFGVLAVALLRRSVNERTAPRWLVLATRQVAARRAYTVVQVSALAVGLLALVLLVLLRTDLVASWRQASPADAPNRFVINIAPEQGADFRQALQQAGVQQYDWYPMFRGRLVARNGRAVSAADYGAERAQRLVEREFNLSYSATLPPQNTLTAGRWTPEERQGVSVEAGLAETLGIQLGDTLRFDVAGTLLESQVTSLRKVDWSSMHANFFVLYPVGHLDDMPVTFLAAFQAPGVRGFDNALVRRFPNVTSVDMGQTLAQVQRVLDQVINAVQFLFAFTLAAGLLVLFAAVTATREERAREFAILRALGASGALLRQVQGAELAGVGLLAGALAATAAWGVGWALAHYVFELAWTAPWWVPLPAALLGAALALAAGWWGLRGVLQRPVVETLRRSAE